MSPSVYVETSVISYLSAKPSRDIVVAAHQQLTRQWWRSRSSYSCHQGVNMKRRDPIIEELHRVREDIGKAHDFDVRRIAAAIRQHEDENREGVVRESPKRSARHKKAS